MAVCAEADCFELEDALQRIGDVGPVQDLRAPETGLVMARGRVGGDGAPFNFGEATVTRATVRLASGETGFSYQLGRDGRKARLSAILDALAQAPDRLATVDAALVPIIQRIEAARALAERRTAATRVNFFTMVRGED
jgi:alpha-D-ribose 1-methylphosphonate 5-triphosphate synthase subunit PhnG